MVKIRKGNHETTVTMGSYKNVFKPLGSRKTCGRSGKTCGKLQKQK